MDSDAAGRSTAGQSTYDTNGPTEDGSVTIEHVIWAVAFIAIAGIVVVAIRTYVTTQAGNIQ